MIRLVKAMYHMFQRDGWTYQINDRGTLTLRDPESGMSHCIITALCHHLTGDFYVESSFNGAAQAIHVPEMLVPFIAWGNDSSWWWPWSKPFRVLFLAAIKLGLRFHTVTGALAPVTFFNPFAGTMSRAFCFLLLQLEFFQKFPVKKVSNE